MDVPDLAAVRAALSPERVALVDTATGRERSYQEVEDRVGRGAAVLRDEFGVRAGDRVGVLARNRAETIELLLACGRLGALLVPLSWRLAAAELAALLAEATPKVLVSDHAHAPTTDALAGAGGAVGRAVLDPGRADGAAGDRLGAAGWEAALAATGAPVTGRGPVDEHEPWYLLYTSGTTGRPKAVVNTFGMALVNHLNIGTATGLTAADTTLNALPSFHTGGINLYTLPTLLVGGTAVIQESFDPGEALELLAGRVTAFFGVPAMYQLLAAHPAFPATDLTGVRSWAAGGSALPVWLAETLAARGILVRQGMGMTETGPTAFLTDQDAARRKPGSVGRPQLLVQVRLVGTDGHDVPDGQPGEVWYRGPGITPGYWRQPEATAAAFAPGGWLRSGDVARRDADGDYHVVGRIKEMFISGGENVYPAEVERVLESHPAVAEAAVVGVPDPRWGEVGRAFVVPAPGRDPDTGELRDWCNDRLARFKVPRAVTVLTALPRNALGKIDRQTLRAQATPPDPDRAPTT